MTALLPDVSNLWVIAAVCVVTITVALCVIAVPPIVAETIVVSSIVAVNVPVATPLELVAFAGWVSRLMLPVCARTTVAPLIGFPLASFAVTVMVEVPPPVMIEVGAAATVD